jgi:TonB-dependent receptor
MKEKIPKSKTSGIWLFLITLGVTFFLFASGDTLAQSTGEIVGRVFDTRTDDYLPGANVILEGTYLGAASDRDGLYRITNVPPGTYTLKAIFIGYKDYTATVTMGEDGGRVIQDVPLEISYIEADEIVVVGERQGQAKALSIQRTATNIKNVVAEEQMQRFPDLNTAEVIQRLPAISVERDQGEARYVLIRGTEPRLSTTTINGEKVASPEDEGRLVGLDVISANQLASVEVTKAITPDMDGDAIGGAVNLVTKSAFDYNRQVLYGTVGGSYGDLRGKASYQADLTYANRFGKNRNIGLTVSGSYHRFDRGSDDNEMEWGSEDDINGTEIPWALQDLQLRDYWKVQRERYGVSGALEYRLSQGNQFFVNGMYNYRTDDEWRNRLRIRPDKGDYNSATDISEAAIERALRDRIENQTIYSVSAGGQHQLNKLGVDFRVAYSYGEEAKPDELAHAFELDEDVDLILNLSDTDIPQYRITNLQNGYELQPGNYELDEIEWSDQLSTDKNMIAALNLKYPFMLGQNQGQLKFGGKLLLKDRKDENKTIVYGWEGTEDILMSRYIASDYNDNFMDGDYDIGFLPDGDKWREFFENNRDRTGRLEGEFDHEDADPANYKAKEDVYAYYGMATLNFGKGMVLGGLRHEFTKTDYTGNIVTFNEDGDYESTQEVQRDSSYSHILPSLHVRYSITPRSNIRAAYTRTLARPNYYDLVPYNIILREDEEIARGNPTLKPTTSHNVDLLVEYYMQGIGILSGGFFYKALDNIIFPSIFDEVGGPYDGYEVVQPINGETATLYGIEINWQQQFVFLPGFWSGFGVYANYTYTDSKADLTGRDDTVLPGQSGDVANFALSYEKYGFQGRVSLAYFGKYIFAVGDNSDEDIYYDENLRIDFTASQRITRYLQAYLQFVNLNNTPLRFYIGDTKRPIQREFYSWWTQFGLKVTL